MSVNPEDSGDAPNNDVEIGDEGIGDDAGDDGNDQQLAIGDGDGNAAAFRAKPKLKSQKSMKAERVLQKQGSFLPTQAVGQASRRQLIEFLNVLNWTRACASSFPVVIVLWLVILASVNLQAGSENAFALRKTMTDHILNIEATSSRGVAPSEVYSEASGVNGSVCKCACTMAGIESICDGTKRLNASESQANWIIRAQAAEADGRAPPPAPGPIAFIDGNVFPDGLQLLRTRGAQYVASQNHGSLPKPLKLEDLQTLPDVWFWIQHGFVPDLLQEVSHDTPLALEDIFATETGIAAMAATGPNPGLVRSRNQVIAGLRFRQRRNNPGECRGDERAAERYAPEGCYSSTLRTTPYGPGEKSFAEGFLPEEDDPAAFNVYIDVLRPLHVALETLQYMLWENRWLDTATVSLELHAMMINAEADPPLFTLLEVRFDFDKSGGLKSKVEAWSTNVSPYPTFIHFLLDFVWLCLIVYILLQQIAHLAIAINDKTGTVEMVTLWNVMDWSLVFISFVVAAIWWIIIQELEDYKQRLTELPAVPAFGVAADEVRDYHDAWGKAMNKLSSAIVWREIHRLSLFWYTLILTLQFFKFFRGQPKLYQIACVIMNAGEDLLHFTIVFLVIFLNFAFSGFMIWGLQMAEWSTPAQAINTSFRALMGNVDLTDMYHVAPVSTVAWFVMFLSALVFIMLNLLLAMIFDHYTLVKKAAGSDTGIVTQLRIFIKDSWQNCKCYDFFRCCCICFLCCCKRRNTLKTHDEMLDALMDGCNYTIEEKKRARRSSLGTKFQFTDFEKKTFTGQALRMQQLNENGRWDLQAINTDETYIDRIQEEAVKHTKREFDPEDLKVSQLRELVTMAEAEMVEMQDRLNECQTRVKKDMGYMTRQLQSVEKLIHISLEELFLIAASAGVPDKVDAPLPMPGTKFDPTLTSFYKSNDGISTSKQSAKRKALRHLGQQEGVAQDPMDMPEKGWQQPPRGQFARTQVENWHQALTSVHQFARSKRLGAYNPK